MRKRIARKKKLFMSCFIFNLIATVDKAQIQTFPHIKKSDVRSFRCCVYPLLMMVGEGKKWKTSSSLFFSLHLENSPEILRYKLDKHLFNLLNFFPSRQLKLSFELLNILMFAGAKSFNYIIFVPLTDEG